tara:strand:- start:223 stop:636 length:414 start_codon:yes stop_codon:yes gene_type:complete
MALLEHVVDVSFGDCDPAGIVFYPNYFRWMDATFHRLLQERVGGHARLCRDLEAVGIGLMDVGMNFRMPVRDGQRVLLRLMGIDWGSRSLTLRYDAEKDGQTVFTGYEKRGIFVMQGGCITAAAVEPLKVMIVAKAS